MQLEQQQAALSRWKQGLESSLQERKQPVPRKAQVQYMLGRLHHVSGQLFSAAAKMYGLQPACERLCSALGWELSVSWVQGLPRASRQRRVERHGC